MASLTTRKLTVGSPARRPPAPHRDAVNRRLPWIGVPLLLDNAGPIGLHEPGRRLPPWLIGIPGFLVPAPDHWPLGKAGRQFQLPGPLIDGDQFVVKRLGVRMITKPNEREYGFPIAIRFGYVGTGIDVPAVYIIVELVQARKQHVDVATQPLAHEIIGALPSLKAERVFSFF